MADFAEIDEVLSSWNFEKDFLCKFNKPPVDNNRTEESIATDAVSARQEIDNAPIVDFQWGILLAKMPDKSFQTKLWTTMLKDHPENPKFKTLAYHMQIYARKPMLHRKKIKHLVVLIKTVDYQQRKCLSLTVKDESAEIRSILFTNGLEQYADRLKPGCGIFMENVYLYGNPNKPCVNFDRTNLKRIYYSLADVHFERLEFPENEYDYKNIRDKLMPFMMKTTSGDDKIETKLPLLRPTKPKTPHDAHVNLDAQAQSAEPSIAKENDDDEFFSQFF